MIFKLQAIKDGYKLSSRTKIADELLNKVVKITVILM